ncbi:MAG: hypothetical protein MH472_03705, partial [Bacteroidia bacterium]|nr:hypothetical protein [Bacteroidia bacterium]
MREIKDGGYAQQVENFGMLIQLAQQLGSAYMPANENISLVSLEKLKQNAQSAIKGWVTAKIEFNRIGALRKDELDNLFLLVTCISREVKVCGIRGEILNDIMSKVRQFRGQRKKSKILVLDQAEPKTKQRKSGINYSCERKFELFYQLVG